MKAIDIMTRDVVTIGPQTPVQEIAAILIDRRISAVPVVNSEGAMLGLVSEGDLLRRSEISTEKRRRRLVEFFIEPGRLADEYVRSHAERAEEVMTSPVISIEPDTRLDEIVDLLEKRRINRVPVVENGKLVGIVTRGNLMRALAAVVPRKQIPGIDDRQIRDMLSAELKRQSWAKRREEDIVVKDGVVHLWGAVTSDSERNALCIAARNIPGVKEVRDHMVFPPFAPGMP